MSIFFHWFITGLSSGPVLFCSLACVVCRRLSLSVTLHGRPAGGFSRAGQAMMSCRLKSNYSYTVTLHGGPVHLSPVKATPCFQCVYVCMNVCVCLCVSLILHSMPWHFWFCYRKGSWPVKNPMEFSSTDFFGESSPIFSNSAQLSQTDCTTLS